LANYTPKLAVTDLVWLPLKPSYFLAWSLGCLGIFASICVLFIPNHSLLIVMMVLCIVSSSIYAILHHALLKLPWSLVCLSCNQHGQWQVLNLQGKTMQVTIHASSFVSSYFTVVNMTGVNMTVVNMYEARHKKMFTMLVFPHRVDAEAFRRLRVHLRWRTIHKRDSAMAEHEA
jgi:hypothetical protein